MYVGLARGSGHPELTGPVARHVRRAVLAGKLVGLLRRRAGRQLGMEQPTVPGETATPPTAREVYLTGCHSCDCQQGVGRAHTSRGASGVHRDRVCPCHDLDLRDNVCENEADRVHYRYAALRTELEK